MDDNAIRIIVAIIIIVALAVFIYIIAYGSKPQSSYASSTTTIIANASSRPTFVSATGEVGGTGTVISANNTTK